MKISEYNDMMKYLTRSPQIKLPKEKKDEFGYTPSQNKEIEKYIATRPSAKESNGAWKRFVEPEKLAEKRKKESASKEQLEGLEKRLANARAMNPEFPGMLDSPCYVIGKNWCGPKEKKCDKCFMNNVCPSKV